MPASPHFSIITGKSIHRIIHADVPGCIARVEAAYRAHGRRETVNPNSYFLLFPDKPTARIIALPAALGGEGSGEDAGVADAGVAGIKWISSFPSNLERGIPRASAVLILNDAETGYPFACLESSIISAARTAGSAVLAAEKLVGSRKARTVAFVGNGLIARYHWEFFRAAGWQFERVLVNDLQRSEAERFAAQVIGKEVEVEVEVVDSSEEALSRADLSVFATVAGKPYLSDPKLVRHNPVILNVSLRDFSPEIVLACQNVLDDVEHCLKANTSPHLTEQATGHRDFIQGTLPDVLEGRLTLSRQRPILFSPFGLGVLDLAVGRWVYEEAVRAGEALRVDDFFYELTR